MSIDELELPHEYLWRCNPVRTCAIMLFGSGIEQDWIIVEAYAGFVDGWLDACHTREHP